MVNLQWRLRIQAHNDRYRLKKIQSDCIRDREMAPQRNLAV